MSESELYNEKVVNAIEGMFGDYERPPKLKTTKNLYKTYGAWGQTTYIKESKLPILIEVDEDLLVENPREGVATIVHEMLEWRGIERGEEFPHFFAESNQDEIIPVAMLTPLDYFLHSHPILSLIIRGY
jgi:hypothetical protein